MKAKIVKIIKIIIVILLVILLGIIVYNVAIKGLITPTVKPEQPEKEDKVDKNDNERPSTKDEYLKLITQIYGSDGAQFKVISETDATITIQKVNSDGETTVTTYIINKTTNEIEEVNAGVAESTGE